ncbi:MAG: twin-arginine translocation signal domain-containing protein, partial [Rhodobacteraceae bacterium]
MNRRSFLATSAAATAVMGTPMILRAQPSEYVLGASLPLTGPFATAGQLVAPVFALAAKLFNDEGGVAGTPIRFVTEDSGYIPQNALANYQRALATEGTAMIGYFADSTGAMKLIAPELKGENARIMGSTSFASELANPAVNPYQYLSGPTYQSQFDILLQKIKDVGGTTVAFIYSNTEFGRDPLE